MLTSIDMLALLAVMLIGSPHGAFDGAIVFCLGMGDQAHCQLLYCLSGAGRSVCDGLVAITVFALTCFVVLSIAFWKL